MDEQHTSDELGAHVSIAGGVERAPGRAAEIGAEVLQMFTKTPSRWAEREVDEETAQAFRAAREEHGIRLAVSHDSYLINLATPKSDLFEKSYRSFRMELERCVRLGVEYVVTHPGNATDEDPDRGIRQNAEAIGRALEEVPGETMVLLETTAGSGNVLGSRFEELAALREQIPAGPRARVGVCLDTCHVWAAGYDLDGDYDGVMRTFDEIIGLERLKVFHLNDSKTPMDSRRDRHAPIGEGTLGDGAFRALMTDERLAAVAKVLETPKGDDPVANDRRNLARLRGFRT